MMTPEQLQQYIDAALKQRDQFSLIFYPLVTVLSIGGAWLLSYLREKGKNLATKEDIAVITRTQEEIKSELADRSHFSQRRYDREMAVYQDVWGAVAKLKDVTLALRPAMSPPETDMEKKRCQDAFIGAFEKLWDAVEVNRPFYPEGIWKELRSLLQLCRAELWDFKGGGEGERWYDWYSRAMANAEKLSALIDQLAERIRNRLSQFD